MRPTRHSVGETTSARRWQYGALAGLVLLILWLTLRPLGETNLPPRGLCLLCGARGLADAILNVGLFVPLGLLLAPRRHPLFAVLLGVLFSGAIEAAQLVIPGRYASPADVLFNGLGTAIGVALYHARGWVLDAGAPGRDAAAGALALLVGGVLFLTGWLLVPAPPPPPYYVAWEPERPGAVEYDGTVLGAAVGPFQVRAGPLAYAPQVSELVARGAPLGVGGIAGKAPDGFAPLLVLFDANGRDFLLLGIEHHDAIYREHLRASEWRLIAPSVRWRGAFEGLEPGDTLKLATLRMGKARCLNAQARQLCGFTHSAGDGWRLLRDVEPESATAAKALNAGWLALLLLPIGFLARPRIALSLGVAALWYIAIRLPLDTILIAATWPELAGAAAGVLGGIALRTFALAGRRAETADSEAAAVPH